ncbi:hypothetical protein MMC22_000443 [Lobaria immixta]|nr:hypothetical protein [Lobaria immixta]
MEPTFAPKQQDKQAVKYQSLGLISKAIQICGNFNRKYSQILNLVFAYHQYGNELKTCKTELDKRELAAQSGQKAYQAQHEKNMAMKAEVKQKEATLLTPLAAGPMVILTVITF